MYASTARKTVYTPSFNFYTTLTCIALGFVYLIVLGRFLSKDNSVSYLYLLMLVQLTPFIICFSRQKYNYIAFILFHHCVTYSLSKLSHAYLLEKTYTLSPETLLALQQHIICTIIIICTYYFFRYFFFHNYREKTKLQMLTMSRWQLLSVATYVMIVPMFMREIPSSLLILHFALVAADMVLLLCSRTPGREWFASFLRFWVFVSSFQYFIGSGTLAMMGNLAGYFFISACIQCNYRRLIIPIAIALSASAVQNVKAQYRNYLWEYPFSSYSERLSVLGTILFDRYVENVEFEENATWAPEKQSENNADLGLGEDLVSGFGRAGDDSLERVMSWTPSKVPFWEGESYAAIPFLMLPRALWPDKPTRHIWKKFGHVYGFLGEDDDQTSVGVSFIAEGYMNYGYRGMYGVCLFFGILVAFMERLSVYFLRGYYYFSFMVFLMPLMNYSSDLTSMINSIVIITLVIFIFRNQFLKMARRDDYC
jgi:hypothetical protein